MSDKPQTPDASPEKSADATSTDNPKTQPADDMVLVSRTTINYVIIAVMFFAVGLIVGAVSFGSSSSATADIDQDAVEMAVQNVLVDAGLIQPPANMDAIVDDDPFLGPADAPIVIVEFSAYACPYCGRHYNDTLVPLLENYGEYIKYVYRDFPSINPDVSYPASFAANCALEQDAFWEYHEALFADQTGLAQSGGNTSFLIGLAGDLSLDTESFSNCLINNTYVEEVNNDFNAGISLGISGTPSFYINGQAHSGARPYSYFESIIQRELTQAGIDF